jgi:DNA-binding transcriptional regulator PaaX
MLTLVESPQLSEQLREQLVETERRIADLIALRDGLFHMLLRVDKNGKRTRQEEVRSSSHDRLLIERRILETLTAADGRALSTRKLFNEARAASPQLRYSTFRSHLSRLKGRGLIASKKNDRGYWMLPGAANGTARALAMVS